MWIEKRRHTAIENKRVPRGPLLLLDKILLSGATFIALPPQGSFSATVADLIVVITARLDAIHGGSGLQDMRAE